MRLKHIFVNIIKRFYMNAKEVAENINKIISEISHCENGIKLIDTIEKKATNLYECEIHERTPNNNTLRLKIPIEIVLPTLVQKRNWFKTRIDELQAVLNKIETTKEISILEYVTFDRDKLWHAWLAKSN